jgi:hypothetical protein
MPITEKQTKARISNLKAAASARNFTLLQGCRDFDKRAGGVNSKLEGALVGDLDPAYELTQEKPVHRTIINLAAAGYMNVEIAKIVGYSATMVANTLKQPWAREYLINEAKKTVQDEIKAVLESEALPSIRKLVTVRDSEKARPSDVIQASNSLLDRFLGKPTQPITTEAKPVETQSDEELRQQIQRELAVSQPN